MVSVLVVVVVVLQVVVRGVVVVAAVLAGFSEGYVGCCADAGDELTTSSAVTINIKSFFPHLSFFLHNLLSTFFYGT